tara:strand:+ start:334 stop:750 length:417 start_codon:yes stop_codon:yes gene_type:complete
MECKLFKLSNGEMILADSDAVVDSFKDSKNIILKEPVLIKTFRMIDEVVSNGKPVIMEQFTMQPWIKMSKSDTITIPSESIIAVVEIDTYAIESYKEFVKSYDSLQEEFDNAIENDEKELEFNQILEEYGKDTKTTIH